MTYWNSVKAEYVVILPLMFLGSVSGLSAADTVKINGMIKARSGASMIVQTADSPNLVVLLTDNTEVGQIQGLLQVRRKEMSMAALIPGLEIQAEGAYDDQHQLIATVVKFKGNDLERAKSIQAGLHQTNVQTQKNQEELEKQNANLKAQAEALQQQHEKIVANQEKIAANKAAIAAASARFGQLDDYYILDEVSVLFANGKTNVDAQYQPQLLQLAEKAKGFEGYMIQVVGYASSTGSAALNQQLSEERAGNVTNILVQDGNIPLTNMLAPGAMGESRQIGDPNTEQGQAENRRVVVRVLQNKGIIGSQEIK